MKKFTLLFAFSAIMAGSAMAQCTPSPIWTGAGLPGLWPNATIGWDSLPNGTKGIAYNPSFGLGTLTLVVPADTVITPSDFGIPIPGTIPIAIDAMNIGTVTGLPPGMTTACDIASCSWLGGTNGCISFSGTPGASGDYDVQVPLSITVTLPTFGAFTTPEAPVSYRLHIDPNVSIDELDMNAFSADNNAPNPFSTTSTLRYNMVRSGNVGFEVFDLSGNRVQSSSHAARAGVNELTIDASDLAPGIYIYHLTDGESLITRKMTVVK